jgi:hypothetical protein
MRRILQERCLEAVVLQLQRLSIMRGTQKVIVIVAFWPFAVPTESAWAWGNNGHRIIGATADSDLKEKAPVIYQRVESILEGASLSEASAWADCAKGYRNCQRPPSTEEISFAANNSQHHMFHYTDVAIQQTQYKLGAAGTRSDDVVQVLSWHSLACRMASHPFRPHLFCRHRTRRNVPPAALGTGQVGTAAFHGTDGEHAARRKLLVAEHLRRPCQATGSPQDR